MRPLFWKTLKAASARCFSWKWIWELSGSCHRLRGINGFRFFINLSQYDRYLEGMRYRQTYSSFGDFRFFTLLFITIGEERIENIRRQMEKLPTELSEYYRLTTYAQAMGDFFSPIWKSRMLTDTRTYALVRDAA